LDSMASRAQLFELGARELFRYRFLPRTGARARQHAAPKHGNASPRPHRPEVID
jgi:hypothetical protein